MNALCAGRSGYTRGTVGRSASPRPKRGEVDRLGQSLTKLNQYRTLRSDGYFCAPWAALHCGFALHYVCAHLAFSVAPPSLYPPPAAVGFAHSVKHPVSIRDRSNIHVYALRGTETAILTGRQCLCFRKRLPWLIVQFPLTITFIMCNNKSAAR